MTKLEKIRKEMDVAILRMITEPYHKPLRTIAKEVGCSKSKVSNMYRKYISDLKQSLQ